MSPVSRGRRVKSRKSTSSQVAARRGGTGRAPTSRRASTFTALQALTGPRQRPGWFDTSLAGVLDRADALLAATGPRELEQATAELLGAELHRLLIDEREGFWLDWWFEELAGLAATRIRAALGGDAGGWPAPWRLLHGLTSIGSPALAATARSALTTARSGHTARLRQQQAEAPQPRWLGQLPRIAATGEVWRMRDSYGTRQGVIAGFQYPNVTDPCVYLFDIDACGVVILANAGVYDDVAQAAAAWRTLVGEAAHDAAVQAVPASEELACLVHCDNGAELLRGDESRSVMDNWFRAPRRVHDLAEALRKRGRPLPVAHSLYRDVDTEPTIAAFTAWYTDRHGGAPDPDAVDELAAEWLEGCLPGTEHAVSPHRVQYQRTLINDWVPDDPVTVAVKAILPDWVRFHGEQSGLPRPLIERAVAVADGQPRADTDCPGLQI